MKKTLVSMFCAGILFFLTSCSGITGYSVLLWSIPEHKLQDTDVVPATCDTDGSAKRTASVNFKANDDAQTHTYTDTKDVVLDKLNHKNMKSVGFCRICQIQIWN